MCVFGLSIMLILSSRRGLDGRHGIPQPRPRDAVRGEAQSGAQGLASHGPDASAGLLSLVGRQAASRVCDIGEK